MKRGIANDHRHEPGWSDVLKGALAGAVGGFVGSWAMNQAHGLSGQFAQLADGGDSGGSSSEEEHTDEEETDATVATAVAISRKVFHTNLTKQQKQAAGPIVHYGYGTLMGALYGATCELVPEAPRGAGVPFATLLWLAGDEVAVPLLGLGAPPTQAPLSSHVDAFVAHVIYGITTDGVQRVVRDGL